MKGTSVSGDGKSVGFPIPEHSSQVVHTCAKRCQGAKHADDKNEGRGRERERDQSSGESVKILQTEDAEAAKFKGTSEKYDGVPQRHGKRT